MNALKTTAILAGFLGLLSLQAEEARHPFSVDLRHTYFSRRESWMTLYPTEQAATLRYYFARMYNTRGEWLDLTFLQGGKARPVAFAASASELSIRAGGEGAPSARAYFVGPLDTVVDGRGFDLRIGAVKEGLDLATSRMETPGQIAFESEGWTCRIEVKQGRAEREGKGWVLRAVDGRLRVAFRLFRGQAPAPLAVDPDHDVAAIQKGWESWRAKMPAVAPERTHMAETAWWNLWSLYAPKDDVFVTPAVLEAKAHMNSEWPWDHCFVAQALGMADLDAALDEFMIPFANMDAKGQLPDRMLPDEIYRGASKPPIHGWTLMQLMKRHAFTQAQLERVYGPLVKWTEFWFAQRDLDQNGLPAYGGEHSGWESGWDNATVLGNPKAKYESPDLQAYLVLQMKALGHIAGLLGKAEEAKRWETRAVAHQKLLMKELWNGQSFTVREEATHAAKTDSACLLPYMPLILGEHLDKAVFNRLADDLEARFLTPFGPATEAPTSPAYTPDGYWRGPIWGPTTFILVDGLARGGRKDLAREIARRFSDMVQRVGGHYENYDALTGQPLCCKGYAWTAAVDLLFAHDYLR
ncbi:hypothetical protein GETHLI_19630 [Geothrix limicola]|uniref:Mannosylglycerate hydrolase MGH1-like glycoside hydrolase domain-containing protein n=1 Tax=Geothrix limicola TaxID=2927978 RepID=A0ABQ5QG96_9BACT|nr:trehalase family glycosidase [Geothrix limicola]GLH73461.1 hypothetical protein GETHLI_19630 [Geothrix limicola]